VYGHHAEGLRWLKSAINEGSPEAIGSFLFNELLCAASWLAFRLGNVGQAREYAERGLAAARAADETIHIAETLNLLGYLEDRATNYQRADALLRESLEAYRVLDHKVGTCETLISLGGIQLDHGDFRAAERRFREVLDASDPETEARTHARALDMISVVLHTEGRAAESLGYAERAHDLYRIHGDVRGTVISLDHIGKCARALGDVHRAWECHRESLQLRREVGDPRGFSVWLEAVASLLVSCGAYSPAAQVLAAVDSIRMAGSFPVHGHERVEIDWAQSKVRQSLSSVDLRVARESGSRMNLVDAIEFALLHAERAVAGARIVAAHDANRFGLTAREQDVMSGLERRLTDREIAEELSISSRTVSSHVASILNKMNLKSRRDIPGARIA
jgi:non-specific serine/threonine protein kinase